MNSPMATDQRGLWSNRQLIFQLEDKVNPACNGSAWESVPASRYAKIGPCSSQQVGSVTANAAGSSILKLGLLERYHRSVRHLLLRDLRFLAELRRREALPTDVVLHVVTAAIRRRRQKADLGDDDLGAVAALAGLPVVP